MLHKIPEFDQYFVAYLKDDPAQEPIAVGEVRRERSSKQRIRPAEQSRILSFGKSARQNMIG
jgi:hypothetical protein